MDQFGLLRVISHESMEPKSKLFLRPSTHVRQESLTPPREKGTAVDGWVPIQQNTASQSKTPKSYAQR